MIVSPSHIDIVYVVYDYCFSVLCSTIKHNIFSYFRLRVFNFPQKLICFTGIANPFHDSHVQTVVITCQFVNVLQFQETCRGRKAIYESLHFSIPLCITLLIKSLKAIEKEIYYFCFECVFLQEKFKGYDPFSDLLINKNRNKFFWIFFVLTIIFLIESGCKKCFCGLIFFKGIFLTWSHPAGYVMT